MSDEIKEAVNPSEINIKSNDVSEKIIVTSSDIFASRDLYMSDLKTMNITQKVELTRTNNANNRSGNGISNSAVYAESLIEQLITGNITYARMSLPMKCALYEYLYKYNPYIARTIDLHTILPMSSFRIQKPSQSINDICKDYIYNFYEKMLDNCDFLGVMLKAVRYYNLYGKAEILVMDDFAQKRDTIVDDTDIGALAKKDFQLKESQRGIYDKIIEKYKKNPEDIKWEEREKVLKAYGFDFNIKYSGIKKMRVLHPNEIVSLERNDDNDYNIYELNRPKEIDNAFEKFKSDNKWVPNIYGITQKDKDLEEKFVRYMCVIGYCEGYVRLMLKNLKKPTYKIDSNPYNNDGVYVITLNRKINEFDDSSIINRVLESAVDYTVSRRRDRERANMSYKQNRLFSIKDGGPAQVVQLQNEIATASASPQGYDIITNLDVNYSDLSLDVKDRMDFSELKSNSQQDLMVGLGMTDSLLAGGETYSTAFLKVELLTTEYQQFRNEFGKFVQDKIFKPVSIKRAFVTKDDWGNNEVITPSVRFDKLSIARGTEDFNTVITLAQNKWLPVKELLKTMGYDYEEIQNTLKQESSSIFNANVDATNAMAMQTLATAIAGDKNFIKRLAETLGLDDKFVKTATSYMQQQRQAEMAQLGMAGGEEDYSESNGSENNIVPQVIQGIKSGQIKEEDVAKLVEQGQLSQEDLAQIKQQLQGQNE